MLLYKRARAVKFRRQEARFRKIRSLRLKTRLATFYGLRRRAIRGLVNALTSIFRPRISNYSAALNAAQR
jgi:hypothetical protein